LPAPPCEQSPSPCAIFRVPTKKVVERPRIPTSSIVNIHAQTPTRVNSTKPATVPAIQHDLLNSSESLHYQPMTLSTHPARIGDRKTGPYQILHIEDWMTPKQLP